MFSIGRFATRQLKIWSAHSKSAAFRLVLLALPAVDGQSPPDATCTNYVREDIQKDIQKYGGAEIRNLTIEVAYNTGSDEGLQFALLDFEYRLPNQPEWQHGEMHIMTDHSAFSFRYLCRNIMAGG